MLSGERNKRGFAHAAFIFVLILSLLLSMNSFAFADTQETGDAGNKTEETTYISLASASVVLEQTEFEYTGKSIVPALKVSLTEGETTQDLTEGQDYEITYRNSKGEPVPEVIDAGNYDVEIQGKGDYTGTAPGQSFKVNSRPINDAVISGVVDKEYTGQEIKQDFKVEVSSGGSTLTLSEGQDYEVTYKNNTAVGTAELIVEGTGNYSGSKTVTFEIVSVPTNKGWQYKNGEWYYYYDNGKLFTNGWIQDSVGWCYATADGTLLKNGWAKDSSGWCWLNASGYWEKGKWIHSNGEWYYLKPNGYRAENMWVQDSVGWCYANSDGKLRKNAWAYDSKGKCWLDGNGYWVKNRWVTVNGETFYIGSDGYVSGNRWVYDGSGWYYVTANGARLKNGWAKDSVGWCWMDSTGRMTRGQWIKYAGDWYYLKPNGYMASNEWAKDSSGWCYLTSSGRLAKNTGAKDSSAWYYLDSNGHIYSGSYVIVSTADQTLYYYENGSLVLKTPVVTGKWYPKNHSTPTGTYYLRAKQTNQTLKGLEDDGKTKYESHVSYWMPFIGNSWGLHDATWRSSFGGSIYKYNGSHGCVNMPYSAAKNLYARIKVGTLIRIQ